MPKASNRKDRCYIGIYVLVLYSDHEGTPWVGNIKKNQMDFLGKLLSWAINNRTHIRRNLNWWRKLSCCRGFRSTMYVGRPCILKGIPANLIAPFCITKHTGQILSLSKLVKLYWLPQKTLGNKPCGQEKELIVTLLLTLRPRPLVDVNQCCSIK